MDQSISNLRAYLGWSSPRVNVVSMKALNDNSPEMTINEAIEKVDYLNTIPPEILWNILIWAGTRHQLFRLILVCKEWSFIGNITFVTLWLQYMSVPDFLILRLGRSANCISICKEIWPLHKIQKFNDHYMFYNEILDDFIKKGKALSKVDWIIGDAYQFFTLEKQTEQLDATNFVKWLGYLLKFVTDEIGSGGTSFITDSIVWASNIIEPRYIQKFLRHHFRIMNWHDRKIPEHIDWEFIQSVPGLEQLGTRIYWVCHLQIPEETLRTWLLSLDRILAMNCLIHQKKGDVFSEYICSLFPNDHEFSYYQMRHTRAPFNLQMRGQY